MNLLVVAGVIDDLGAIDGGWEDVAQEMKVGYSVSQFLQSFYEFDAAWKRGVDPSHDFKLIGRVG